MTNTSHPALSRRRLTAAGLALAGLLSALFLAAAAAQASQASHPAAATGATTQTIHLVAHEKQRKFFNNGGFGDEEIFRGILDNAAGTTQIGIFAGTLTSISANDSLNLATVDLQLPGGQITVQGFFFGTQSRIVHAITGGTGSYTGAEGEFSFTFPSPGVLDMTLTLRPADPG
jgi:opacity protein-like surface antigen